MKDESGSVTQSQIQEVIDKNRVEELARMLAGHESSESARKHAAELLEESQIHVFQ
jgi:DNA repair protein RecN (Recombination protein N)